MVCAKHSRMTGHTQRGARSRIDFLDKRRIGWPQEIRRGQTVTGNPRQRRTEGAKRIQSPQSAANVRVGPAGWSYADWGGIVYPAKKPRGFHEASYLSEYFDTIEINTSFYHPLKPMVCWQWLERVSGNRRFQFTAKLWQRFTHEGTGTDADEKEVRPGYDMLM